jgi:hypothetical protein
MRHWLKVSMLAGVGLLGSTSTLVWAQATGGMLEYSPLAPQAVPVPLTIVAAIGCLLALVAWRFMRLDQLRSLASKTAPSVFLGALGVGLFLWQTMSAPYTDATPSVISLDNPAGGSVLLPLSISSFENTSGVPLQITAITLEPACQLDVDNDCTVGLILNAGDFCTTDISCP